MYIKNENDSLFEVMAKHDCASDPEQRWKDLRAGVCTYNADHGTNHEFTGELLNQYWDYLRANECLIEPNYDRYYKELN